MPDLRQSLRDFVATSNSGKYATEQELLSKFPELKGYNVQALKDFVATSNSGKYTTEEEVFSKFPEFGLVSSTAVKKKDIGVSSTQAPQRGTTVSPSASGSSATQKQKSKSGILMAPSPMGGYMPLAVPALFSEAGKSVYQTLDDLIVSARKGLQEEGFFDDDIPDTDTPITDAIKKKIVSKKGELLNLNPEKYKPQMYSDGGPLDPTPLIKATANIGLKIINSTLPQDKKNVIIAALNLGDATLKNAIRGTERIQDIALPKDNVAVNVSKGIVGMAPDLLLARAMGTPAASEGRLTKAATEITKDAKPLLQKYLPKAAKFIEEAIQAPFTKIMAAKGTVSGIANAKEGEDIVEAGIEGTMEGAAEGIYMHALGVTAGSVAPVASKLISKTGVNSAISTGIANPLANAGVFTTARAIRTGLEEGRLISADEAATEAGMGIGFSLLHAGSLAKNHNELNHYADNTLKTNEVESFKRVVNETKDNLDLVYNRDLTPEDVSKLEGVRDELKSAIIKEPDLKNKQLLINEALKIQNQLDAHSAINNIVENKDAIIDEINKNPDTTEDVKEFYTQKIAAIADYFDASEFGLKKKELNLRINEAQKRLDDAALAFTNLKKPSDRIEAKIEVEKRKAEVEDLNNQLTELITNKVNQDAVQIESTAEIPVQSETGVSETMEGRTPKTKPEDVAEQTTQEKIDEARKANLTSDERFSLGEANKFENAKVGDEFILEEYKDGEFKSYETKVKEIVDGKIIFENGKTQDDISSYSNKTAEDAWFAENKPEVVAEEKTLEGPPPMPEGFDVFAENKPTEVVAEANLSNIESFETSKGSVYTVLPNGKTQRFKTATSELNEPNDLIVFVKFKNSKQEQDFLSAQNRQDGQKLYVIDSKGNVYDTNEQVKGKDVKLAIIKDGKVIETVETSLEPKEGYNTFDQRRYEEKGEKYRSTHLGNKVTKINYKTNITPTEVIAEETKNKLGEPTISEIEDGKLYEFQNENGLVAGVLTSPTEFRIDGITAAEVGKGKGSEMFEDLIQYLKGIGVKTISTKSAGEGAVSMHQKAVDKGLLTEVSKNGREAVFTINENKTEAKPIEVVDETKPAEINTEREISEEQDIANEIYDKADIEGSKLRENVDSESPKLEYDGDNESIKKEVERYDRLTRKIEKDGSFSNRYAYGLIEKLIRKGLDTNNTRKLANALRKAEIFNSYAREQRSGNYIGTLISDSSELIAGTYHILSSSEKLAATKILTKLAKDLGVDVASLETEANRKVEKIEVKAEATPVEKAIQTLQESKEYAEADDIQKEKLVRDTRKEFGLKEKSSPSVNRLFGKIKDIAKVTMTEKAALVKQIKDLAKGAKVAKVAIKNATKDLAAQVEELQKGGKINATQAKVIVKKFSNVNVLSETSVRRFTDYMTKVFDNAEYANELKTAKDTKKSISKISKNKEKNANLRELGKKFTQIDPSMVDDIYAYNKAAKSIEDAIKGSSLRGLKETVNIAEVNEYIDKTIESQKNKMEQDRIAESEDLIGLTEQEVNDILEGKKELAKEKENELKEKVQTQFNIYSDQIKKAIETGKNPITGEDVSYSKADKEIIEKFMAMDLTSLNIKEAIAASDSLNNFITNESTANMENVLSKYTGEYEAKNFEGVAKEIKKLWNKLGGRIITEGGTPMGEVFTKMFKGATAGNKFGKASGFNKIVNGKATAVSKINAMTKEYINKFYKKEANGEAFNTAYNDTERGIVSDLRRHLVGDEQQIEKEFKRRVGILEQSIKRLEEGSEKEQNKAKIYQEVYDKVVKDSKSIEDVENKTNKVNLDAIKYWQETHENNWDDISKYMLNVHNTVLEKGVNYSSPDKYAKLSTEETSKPLQDSEAMYGRNGDFLYKKEASGLMKAEFPEKLPEGRYRDYSFDQNNVNSMHDALIDVNTGAAIRQLEAFRKSEGFKKIIPSVEDRNLVNRRFKLYVENLRNRGNTYGAEDLKPVIKVLDNIGTIGVGLALGSPTQMGKQTVPVLFNTLANAGRANLGAPFDPKFIKWLNESGYAIGNRGVESQAQIESLNKKIEIAAKKGPIPLAKAVKAARKFWLREFLVRGDVYIAKASWQTYYEKALKKQGEDVSKIDYSDHKINEDAADYAEMMTQRQQNVNDPDLGGSWFTSNRTERKILGKIFLNFANFRMNQSSRLAADLTTLEHWNTSTAEDKAIAARSLGGYALESMMYRLMSVGIAIGIGNIAQSIRGTNETDKEKEERVNKLYKSARSGAATDFFSPAPFLDFAVKPLTSFTTEAIEEQTGLPLSTYGTSKQTFIESLGGYGIVAERAVEMWDVLNLAATGTYTDEFGKEKEISEEDQETIKTLAPAAVLSAIGVLPTDIGTGVRNVVKYSKIPKEKMDKKLLKERYPDMYERMYGEGTRDNRMEERKKEMKERMKRD